MKIQGEEAPATINMDHFMMNGTVLKNTSWIVTVCVFTGNDTRMMMNS